MQGPAIKELRVTPIAISDPPLRNAVGVHAPFALRTIIEIITDDGITGISEIPGNQDINKKLESVGNVIAGYSPFQLHTIKQAVEERFGKVDADRRGSKPWDSRTMVHIYSAIEVACLDIQGKVVGLPVADLLGGMVRDRIPFGAYLFYKFQGAGGDLGFDMDPESTGWSAARQMAALTPREIVDQARAMCNEFGFRSIKLKGGVFEPAVEVETIKLLRDSFGPDYPLRLDPNGVWSVETAIRNGKELEGLLEYYEDPTHGQEGMAVVRRGVKMPLATNMCTTSFADIPSSISLGSEDIILADHHFWGGLKESVILGKICETFGRGLSMHSNSHVGISLMAMVHLAAAVPNLSYDLDTHYPWQSEEVIRGGRIWFDDGMVTVPREPGLGVELDYKALETLHKNYLECGITGRDDFVEMKKLDPEWDYREVKW
jgi:glucarate dehydratase